MLGEPTFGKNLKWLRENRQLGQKEVADHIHKSAQAYSQYELGKREPDIGTLIKLADYFNVTVDRLLRPNPPKNPSSSVRAGKRIQAEEQETAPSDQVILLRSDEFSKEAVEKIRAYVEDLRIVEKIKKGHPL